MGDAPLEDLCGVPGRCSYMKYDELYKTFKEEIPEGYTFFEVKEKENLIDETEGIHLVYK